VYTDEAALHLHDEVAKLPWVGAQIDAQKVRPVVRFRKIPEIVAELIEAAKSLAATGSDGETGLLPWLATPRLPGSAALRSARQAGPQRSEEELDGHRHNLGPGQSSFVTASTFLQRRWCPWIKN
jgi:hypothetical protein